MDTTLVEKKCDLTVKALKENLGGDLVAVALFGSCARGDSHSGSDIDILVIAENLHPNRFQRVTGLNRLVPLIAGGGIGLVADTPEEFLSGFPSYYLDLGLDAQVLYDPISFLKDRLARIREIIEEAGLYRVRGKAGFSWRWRERPTGGYEITWEGYRELAGRH